MISSVPTKPILLIKNDSRIKGAFAFTDSFLV